MHSTKQSSQVPVLMMASGRGSNAWNLWQASQDGRLPINIQAVISDRIDAPVLKRFHAVQTKTTPSQPQCIAVPKKDIDKAEHEDRILQHIAHFKPQLILLAGYMRLLSASFLQSCGCPVLNIHPSLLPEFKGLNAQDQAWEAGVQVAGATVHYVDAGMDTGQVLLQESLWVRGDEGPEGLAQRILHEVEYPLYIKAVALHLQRCRSS